MLRECKETISSINTVSHLSNHSHFQDLIKNQPLTQIIYHKHIKRQNHVDKHEDSHKLKSDAITAFYSCRVCKIVHGINCLIK